MQFAYNNFISRQAPRVTYLTLESRNTSPALSFDQLTW